MSYTCPNCRKKLPDAEFIHTCFDALAAAREAERLAARAMRDSFANCKFSTLMPVTDNPVVRIESYDAARAEVDRLEGENG